MIITEKTEFDPMYETCNVWAAEIVGPHATFRFKRIFLPTVKALSGNTIITDVKLPSHGIFEMGYKVIDRGTEKVLESGSKYYAYFFHKLYEIDKHQVLFALFNMRILNNSFHEENALPLLVLPVFS